MPENETCENCGQKIGKLETAHVWNARIVCARCNERLSMPTSPRPSIQKVTDTVAGRIIIIALLLAGILFFARIFVVSWMQSHGANF